MFCFRQLYACYTDLMNARNTTRAFSLIEILIVIGIIALLSSVILASLSIARQKARDAKRIAEMAQIKRGFEVYFDAKQTYPSTTPAGYSGEDAGIALIVASGFLPQVPTPLPGGSATYIYRGVDGAGNECTGSGITCTSFALGVTLERSDNPALSGDNDQSVGTFYGASNDCVAPPGGVERCFDLKL